MDFDCLGKNERVTTMAFRCSVGAKMSLRCGVGAKFFVDASNLHNPERITKQKFICPSN
jgi:hypothetical protein